jgi:HSP20 family protein
MKEREMLSLVDWFNGMWLHPFSAGDWDLGSVLYSAPTFPPVNVLLNKETKDMVFEFAVAGYEEENLDISFAGDYLILKIKKDNEDNSNFKVIHNGIRKENIEFKYYVPSDKYNQDEVGASLKNGILAVNVPAREEAEKKKVKITK